LCAKGYPGTFDKGNPIYGLDTLRDWQDGFVFHAGTTKVDGRWITAGGRVLGVTARGRGIGNAVQKAYAAINRITWDGMHYRRDIAHRALK
jgi:phosphoribosylamine--glycine ligase